MLSCVCPETAIKDLKKKLTKLILFRRLRLSNPYVPGLWSETHVASNDYDTAPYYISGRNNKR